MELYEIKEVLSWMAIINTVWVLMSMQWMYNISRRLNR